MVLVSGQVGILCYFFYYLCYLYYYNSAGKQPAHPGSWRQETRWCAPVPQGKTWYRLGEDRGKLDRLRRGVKSMLLLLLLLLLLFMSRFL